MELSRHDWVGFQGLFQPHRRPAGGGVSGSGPIHLIVEGDLILTAYAEQEDLSDWIGGSHRELISQARHRQIFAFSRESADRLLQDALSAGPAGASAAPLGHSQFYDQVEQLRVSARVIEPGSTKGGDKASRPSDATRHFLLTAIHGWWAKVLPAAYGIYLRIEGQPDRHFVMVVRRGTFESFHEPDLSSLGEDRRRQPAEVTRYLSERYMVPVQGFLVQAADWDEWSQLRDPWTLVARSLRAGRTRLAPARWRLRCLLAGRAWLGL